MAPFLSSGFIRHKAERIYEMQKEDAALPNPFQACSLLGIHARFYDIGSLKGMYLSVNQIPYIILHIGLSEELTRAVCAHELGHHVLHGELAAAHILNDYELYRSKSKTEAEANLFAAHFLLPDFLVKEVLEEEPDAERAAGLLHVPLELLQLKLSEGGYGIPLPPSDFFRNRKK
ncbi:MAG TPA: ImmA/IrrE family metallo-endopeptidase [Clostridiales bacterium]|nr:ImmA/IrrE family metallo-endopeptidase [Clostridiales bacterium]